MIYHNKLPREKLTRRKHYCVYKTKKTGINHTTTQFNLGFLSYIYEIYHVSCNKLSRKFRFKLSFMRRGWSEYFKINFGPIYFLD